MSQYPPITRQNVAQLTEISQARCGFITQALWSNDGGVLAVSHGAGVSLWQQGFGSHPSSTIQYDDAPVKSIAFDPSGQIIVTASSDTTMRLWSVRGGTRMAVLRTHSESVESVAIDSSGRLLASGSADQTVRVIDLNETMQRRVMRGHMDEVTSVAFISDGRLASSSRDGSVRLWHLSMGKTVAILSGHADWVRALAASPNGKLLASAGRDGTVRIWDVNTGAPTHILTHDSDSRAVSFSPDGAILAADDGGIVRLWDVETGEPLAILPEHGKPVLTLAFHPVGNLLVSGSGDNTVRLWGVAN